MTTLRDLEFRHLVAFDAVAREGTFGRAADRLGYTQSAVSQQIAALERLVGDKLFDRPGGPRPVELTPLGRQLLVAARELLTRVDAIGDDVERFRSGELGKLTVGTFQSVSARVLPVVLGRLKQQFPTVDIKIYETDADEELHDKLGRGELDLSFLVGEWAHRYSSRLLFDDPFVLIARPGQFPIGPVAITRLSGEPMVGQHANSCQLMNETGLRAAGLAPNFVFRSNDNGTVTAMVKAGLGVAILPLLCVDPHDPGIELHSLLPELPSRRLEIAWRSGRTLSPVAERFVELACEVSTEFAGRALPLPA